MTGKAKCAVLRDIRKLIAYENGISYKFEECKFDGECKGYCEKCDNEIRYIQEALLKKERESGIIFPTLLSGQFNFKGDSSISLIEAFDFDFGNGKFNFFDDYDEDMIIGQIIIDDDIEDLLNNRVDDTKDKELDDELKLRHTNQRSLDEIIDDLKNWDFSSKGKI